jgi:uncharacterized protein (DUF2336 family)
VEETRVQLNEAIHALAPKGPPADNLFALARDNTTVGRRALFETVRDMLLDDTAASERERALMGEILRQLVHEVEMELRSKLAAQLAERDDMPPALIVELANGAIEIAYPILLESGVLSDEDLIEVVQNRTMGHQLAISRRASLSQQVSGALVQTGNEVVIASLLDNHGARISAKLMEYLVDQSRQIDRYHQPLLHRPDLSADLAKRMYWWVSAALRKHINEHFSVDAEALDDEIEAVTLQSIDGHERALTSPSEPEQLIERIAELGEFNEEFLLKSLRSGEISLFESALCKMSGLAAERVQRILYEPGAEALAILCRAIDLDAAAYVTIFGLTRRAKDGQQAPTVEQEAQLAERYRNSRREEAEQVLNRWRRSSLYVNALDRLWGGRRK